MPEKVETQEFMLSPSPTQQSSHPPTSPEPEQKKVKMTPARKRPGQSPPALFIKAILRPIFKGIYYVIKAVRGHGWLTLAAIVILLLSITLTNYFATGEFPFGVGNDPFNFHVRGGDGGGEHVKNWLYDLRDGNVTNMSLLQSELVMSQPPDPNQLVNQASQPKAHLVWKSINVIGVYSESDTSLDSFVEVEFTGPGPGGNVNGLMLWHFTTLPSQQGRLLYIHLVDFRPSLR